MELRQLYYINSEGEEIPYYPLVSSDCFAEGSSIGGSLTDEDRAKLDNALPKPDNSVAENSILVATGSGNVAWKTPAQIITILGITDGTNTQY